MYESLSQFLHRPNAHASYTSICVRCFGTAGSGLEGPELESAEQCHVCNKEVLRAHAAISDDARGPGAIPELKPLLNWGRIQGL
jgi:hypothetical protein